MPAQRADEGCGQVGQSSGSGEEAFLARLRRRRASQNRHVSLADEDNPPAWRSKRAGTPRHRAAILNPIGRARDVIAKPP